MAPKECALHPRSMLESMSALKDEEQFCDITIVTGQEEIKAHKFVLIAASDYFRAMFSSDTKESRTGIVSFPDTAVDIVKECINFIYSGKVNFSLDRITEFIQASDMFCLHNLTDLYVEFLGENITTENVEEMLSVARIYQKELLKTSVQMFFWDNLKPFVKSQELQSLPKDNFIYLLSLVENWGKEYEMLKWNAIVTWVKHDMAERKGLFDDCVDSIDLSFLPKQFIREHIVCEALVTDSKNCLRKIVRHDYALEKGSVVPVACSERMTGIISCDTKSRMVYRYSLIEEQWTVFAELPSAVQSNWLDVVEFKGVIYVTTGNAVFSYGGLGWKKLYEGDSKEKYSRCIICGKYIAMVTQGQVVVYEFDVGKSSLIEITRNADYTSNTFAVTSVEECIYVIDVLKGGAHTHAFQISLKTMKCVQISTIPISIAEGSAFGYNGIVYVISTRSKQVVFYNDITKQWQDVPDLSVGSFFAGCNVHLADKLYLYGNYVGKKICSVELGKLMVSEEDKQPPALKSVDMKVSCISFLK